MRGRLHFRSEKSGTARVFTHTGKFVGQGELFIAPGKFPCVSFDSDATLRPFVSRRLFQCDFGGEILTLLGCKNDDRTILPDLIVSGRKRTSTFKSVSILLAGVSDWMDNAGGFRIAEDEISRSRLREHIRAEIVREKARDFRFESEEWVSIEQRGGGERVVRQSTVLTLTAVKGVLSTEEVVELAHKTRMLFSIILGFPIDIESIWDRPRNGARSEVYFVNTTKADDPFEYRQYCFTQSSELFRENAWPRLLQSFYGESSSRILDIWSRMPGLLEGHGNWEQQILAHVSLVDRYSDQLSQRHDVKFTTSEWKATRRRIKLAFRSSIEVDNESQLLSAPADPLLVDSISSQIDELANTRLRTFRRRFEIAIRQTPRSVQKIVALSTNDFTHIKKIRDKVAHGDIPETRDGRNVTDEFRITGKLYVLLLYWCFRGLGFSDDAFTGFLTNSLSPIVQRASLDNLSLDRETQRYPFLQISSRRAYQSIRHARPGDGVVIAPARQAGTYCLDRDLTKEVHKWTTKASPDERLIELFVANRVKQSEVSTVGYLTGAYVQYRGEAHLAYGICVVGPRDLTRPYDRLVSRDSTSGRWGSSELDGERR